MAFQPILRLADNRIVGHEALMRPDDGRSPLAVLDEARGAGQLGALEAAALRDAVATFDFTVGGRLLVNLSAYALLNETHRPRQILKALQAEGQDLSRLVIEITERDIVEDPAKLAHAIGYLRAAGARIALDDFGSGHSNFELWHELAPEFVKIDRFLIHGIADSPGRLTIVKALVQVADGFGTQLVAEGVERLEDLEIVRDLGIDFAQGYLVGRPAAAATAQVPDAVLAGPHAKMPVWPRNGRAGAFRGVTAEHMLIEAPYLLADASNSDAEEIFRRNPRLNSIPVIDGSHLPVGLINRRVFNERMAVPFTRELVGRKSCTVHMHASPVLCDIGDSLEQMSQILLGEDQRYLSDGFIITQDGRYRGVGTGEALVRRVTEIRIETARYANPLTLLPGNIPITEHIGRLLESGRRFVACYCDLNSFKPFNDLYGYFQGDRMIRLVASTIEAHADPQWDFVGHVGGDDFVVLMQSDDWTIRCGKIVADFDRAALALFAPADVERGFLEGEDRSGRPATFALTSLTIGVVHAGPGHFKSAEAIAYAASNAKREAKRRKLGVYLLPEPQEA